MEKNAWEFLWERKMKITFFFSTFTICHHHPPFSSRCFIVSFAAIELNSAMVEWGLHRYTTHRMWQFIEVITYFAGLKRAHGKTRSHKIAAFSLRFAFGTSERKKKKKNRTPQTRQSALFPGSTEHNLYRKFNSFSTTKTQFNFTRGIINTIIF